MVGPRIIWEKGVRKSKFSADSAILSADSEILSADSEILSADSEILSADSADFAVWVVTPFSQMILGPSKVPLLKTRA